MSHHAMFISPAFLPRTAPRPAAEEAKGGIITGSAAGTGWTPRRARPDDETCIRALVRAERLNPSNLHYPPFLVACIERMVVGAAQIRLHKDGSREFGSLVVAPPFRGQGIGSALISGLLAEDSRQLHVICGRSWVPVYEGHGFRRIDARDAPRVIRRNLRIGRFMGHVGRLRGRRPLDLCVMERPERLSVRAGTFA